MVADLRVEGLPNVQEDELTCALCSKEFVPSPRAEMVYAAGIPVGLVCPDCICHPGKAAQAARERARQIRTLARSSQAALPRHMWIRLLQIAHSRADYWDDVAGRIERINAWEMSEEPADKVPSP